MTIPNHRNTIALAKKKNGYRCSRFQKWRPSTGVHHGPQIPQSQAQPQAQVIIMPELPQAMPTPGAPAPGAGIVPRPPGAPGASPGIMTPTPAAAPSANLGAQAHAAGQMKQALQMVEMALPKLPLDSPLRKIAMSFISGVSKNLGGDGQDQGIQQSMLRDLALKAQQSSPQLKPAVPGAPPGAPAPSPAGA